MDLGDLGNHSPLLHRILYLRKLSRICVLILFFCSLEHQRCNSPSRGFIISPKPVSSRVSGLYHLLMHLFRPFNQPASISEQFSEIVDAGLLQIYRIFGTHWYIFQNLVQKSQYKLIFTEDGKTLYRQNYLFLFYLACRSRLELLGLLSTGSLIH